jgi:hypothetical protein
MAKLLERMFPAGRKEKDFLMRHYLTGYESVRNYCENEKSTKTAGNRRWRRRLMAAFGLV